MPADVVIRDAVAADLAAVSALLGQTWHETYDGIYGAGRVADITASWHSPQTLARGLDRPNSAFIVAERHAGIIGTASAIVTTERSHIQLTRLYIRPDRQRQGAGTALLAAILARLPAQMPVTLEVEPANAGAIAFYQRHGFAVTGKTAACGGDRAQAIAALIMSRPASG